MVDILQCCAFHDKTLCRCNQHRIINTWTTLNKYIYHGLEIKKGSKITLEHAFEAASIQRNLYRWEYKLEPRSLKAICAKIISCSNLNSHLLPNILKRYCDYNQDGYLYREGLYETEWDIPLFLLNHVDMKIL